MSSPLDFLPPDGEMAELIRKHDWAATPLGDPAQWSTSLRMILPFMLSNRFPMLLCWGPAHIQIYNDHYIPVLGTKHWQQALGKPLKDCWQEVYGVLQPLVDTPFNGGPATWTEDQELILHRHGFPEEAHFTVAYSPVPDAAAPRGIGGVMATVHEITEKVITERRVKILSELSTSVASTTTDAQACEQTIAILARHPKDVPFALLYLFDENQHELRLIRSTGIPEESTGPASFPPGTPYTGVAWPLALALETETTQLRDGLAAVLPQVPAGPWECAPDSVAVVPLKSHIAGHPSGALVVGLSACIRPDARYMSFLDLLGAQVATAVANARAYEVERRRAEALAEIDRAKTLFFSNVSHEFRTPLTLMLGPLQDALANMDLPPTVQANLDIASRNAERLLKLVNSLLDFARVEAGRVEASFAPVDFSALTADIASNFRSAMERAGLEFTVNSAPLPEPVYVDRDMWEKIVLNLLSNAFKFTLHGNVSLRVAQEDDHAVLEVTDTGVGVSADEVPRLFERFYRVEGTAGRTHEGSGIGLALVHELVKMHGGTVEATSAPGVGTSFRVRIPFGTAHIPWQRIQATKALDSTTTAAQVYVQEALRWLPADQDEPPLPMSVDTLDPRNDRRFAATFNMRVLLADDNADMRNYVRGLLSSSYEVEAVADGAEALAAARRQRPDLVLCDVMMPNLDGFGLVRALRADAKLSGVPVIMLSARAEEEARIEGLEAGADDYVVKPFLARELLARVGAMLELTTMRREELERQRQQLEDADRQKNEFLAVLAHELRNPLAPIRNASTLLARTVRGDANARSIVEVVQRQVSHLSRLVDDLLDISRITQKRVELKMETVAVADIVRFAVETVEPVMFERNQYLHVQAGDGSLYVQGDVSRLVQSVVNLLTNAAKYTERGGRISVTARSQDGQAVIEVVDNGMGIAPDLLPRLFELFVQAERTLTRSQGGLGIGLAVVQRLADMQGGRVTAESEGPGKGSKFSLFLPLVPAPAVVRKEEAPSFCVRPQRILVVDDNVDAADTLSILLSSDGHQITTAYNATDALAQIDIFHPETILIDIGLPDMNGYDMVRQILTTHAGNTMKLVALSGYGEPARGTTASGFHAHLVKPVTPDDLRRVLAEASA